MQGARYGVRYGLGGIRYELGGLRYTVQGAKVQGMG